MIIITPNLSIKCHRKYTQLLRGIQIISISLPISNGLGSLDVIEIIVTYVQIMTFNNCIVQNELAPTERHVSHLSIDENRNIVINSY